jgi:hypothetical protein
MPTALLEPQTMAAQSPKPPDTQSVKLKMDVIESARIVASCRRESITDLLSDILRPIVQKMEREEMTRRLKAGEPVRGPLPGQQSLPSIEPGKKKGGRP